MLILLGQILPYFFLVGEDLMDVGKKLVKPFVVLSLDDHSSYEDILFGSGAFSNFFDIVGNFVCHFVLFHFATKSSSWRRSRISCLASQIDLNSRR